ncbi:histidine phosphatase family protein [Agrobacterium vitis]|uniref:SixA phosphatase family protein n=1 Tax=Rhizobium/Agrobacterium group TaxID=227290 RepID=UPI0008DBF567|nr:MULTISPECIES: histidine phosphatase family protein [Rhizobium/Agrobacterium group]MCF1435090.1 histidine phosphatase family protein [Allorhizobium ampelinum]MUO90496.1 histidine phosphatase family protein [Agrobacterium vitis]MUZ52918.1 histidine phosphatase family protein [Agrobacterium vitis]MUZ91137.1 histidine phosphatase family protein [Agrobacterium vitis]MVA40420.1 histidine phosphatase family protein [Agrobacterium vitis]
MTVTVSNPFRVYLMRHAAADWPGAGQKDFDRPLSNTGYAHAEMITGMAADKGYRPDLVICSTAVRCRQTADAVRRSMCAEDVEIRYVDALYNGGAETYLEILRSSSQQGSIMLIGHNPAIEECLHVLIGEHALASTIPQGYPAGGLAIIDAEDTPSRWQLVDFLQP